MKLSKKSGYLPSLDGWRAIAIVGVLLAHDRSWHIGKHSLEYVMGMGGYGVNLFFAISGFLITTRILEEESLVGSFHIGRFYTRRLFRIQPAQFAYLFVIAVLIVSGVPHRLSFADTWHTWTASLLMYVNFLYRSGSPNLLTGHFWTLAIEEHFYLLLSLVLFFVKKQRAIVLVALFLLFDLPMENWDALRRAGWHLGFSLPRADQWHFAPLFLAACVAVFMRFPLVLQHVKRLWKPWIVAVATIVLALLHHAFVLWKANEPIVVYRHLDGEAPMISTYLFIAWIVATVFHPQSVSTRVLEWKPIRFIGAISYSLYLWHVLVFQAWHVLWATTLDRWAAHPSAYVLFEASKFAVAILVASASYYWLEKPLIRMGHRLAPSATIGRPELIGIPTELPDSETSVSVRHTPPS